MRVRAIFWLLLACTCLGILGFAILKYSGTVATSSPNAAQGNLQGTSLGGTPAPNFRLVDQNDKTVSLSQLKGMPIILTFMYSHCPNFCPLIAQKINTALDTMGSGSQKVAILGISVDPEHDTAANVQAFSEDHGLAAYTRWHYLLGTRSQLAPVWKAYAVEGLPPSAQVISSSQMIHSSVVYLIDKQGHEQALLDYDFTSQALASDLKVLLSQH